MSFTADQLDLAELAASLVGEVRAGILAAERRGQGGLAVVAATIRVGQLPADDDAEVAGGAGARLAEARGPGPIIALPGPSPVVLQGPAAEAGWQVEVSLGEGEALVVGDEGRSVEPGSLPTAFSLWQDRPPQVLKGIDDSRATDLRRQGIHTVGQFAALDEAAIAELADRLRLRRFVDFWVQASLLRSPAPRLAPSPADPARLGDLVGLPPGRLRQWLGPHVLSASAAAQLFDLLAYWAVALDRRALGAVTLAQFRQAVRSG
jgi:hypothetical protein